MKLIEYSDRKLTYEDAFAGVPDFECPDASEAAVSEAGDCWRREYRGAALGDCIAYIDRLSVCGWKTYFRHTRDPIGGIVYTAAFTKGDRLLCAACFDHAGTALPPKFYLTVCLAPGHLFDDGKEVFRDIPLPAGGAPRETAAVGGGYYSLVYTAERRDYVSLCEAMKAAGFQKRFENSEGFDDRVYSSRFTKGDRDVGISYRTPQKQLQIIAGRGAVSPYLRWRPGSAVAFPAELVTKLYMLEMWNFGNSFVVRLRNGRFLISDGGLRCETPYLLDFLESLTEPGEKPVVEGWFISHLHADHMGVLIELAMNPAWSSRFACEGIYISEPSVEMMSAEAVSLGMIGLVRQAAARLRTSSGDPVTFYRPQMGDRYCFADISLDIIMTHEQLRMRDYSGDVNDAGVWLLLTIEGQKILLGGDGDKGGMKNIMSTYTAEYMKADVMSALHHGWNTRNCFTNYCRPKTVLFTDFAYGPAQKAAENEYLRSVAEECLSWGGGTVELAFPYRAGEARILPHFDWEKYNAGETRPNAAGTAGKKH